MNDLVSYNVKHNEANGEDNRDGSNDNLSWNCGVEGEIADPAVDALRERQIRNFAVILMVSQGVPMILAGDESRRTQRGNNNPYNQANDVSWVDWDRAAEHEALRRFWQRLIAFRRRQPVLRSRAYGEVAIRWHGTELDAPGWNDPWSRVLAFTLDAEIHVILNMDDRENTFELPKVEGRRWLRAFDTALPTPDDAADEGTEQPLADETRYVAGARSAVVLVSAPV
jgi:glycogen operon protein